MSQRILKEIISKYSDEKNSIICPRPLAKFCGNQNAGTLLSQIFYWSDKTKGKEFYKSDSEWMDELVLTKHTIRKYRTLFIKNGWIKVRKKRINKSETNFYKVEPKFFIEFEEYMSKSTALQKNSSQVKSEQCKKSQKLKTSSAVVESDQSKSIHRLNTNRRQSVFDQSIQRISKTTENQRVTKRENENPRAAPLGRKEEFQIKIRHLTSKTQDVLLRIFSSGGEPPPDCAYNISIIWRKLYPMEFQGSS